MRGLPLVLLHAYPFDARMWNPVRESLAARARFITPDLRGFGRTPLPRSEREPSLDDAARDVVAMLDRLDLDRVVLGGCSMGGYVTAAVLRQAPERVGGLVLIDTKAGADTDEARAERLAVAERAESEGIEGWLADDMLPKLLSEQARAQRPELVATVRELIDGQRPSGVAWALRAMAARPDSTRTLRDVAVPALVVVGERDTLTPPAVAGDLADALPRARLVTVPRAGHLTPMEAPEEVSRAILDWRE